MKNPNEINEIDPADLLKKVDENPNLLSLMFASIGRGTECIQPSLHIPFWRNFHQENPPQSLPVSFDEEMVIYCKAGVRSLMHAKSYPIWVIPN